MDRPKIRSEDIYDV
jgi:CheY-like chemotaxis protein